MKITYYILLLTVLLTSCLAKEKDTSADSHTSNQIVLIFIDFPEPYSISLNDTKGKAYTPARPELRYYDDNLIHRTISPQTGTNDTIIISSTRWNIEFQHTVKGVDNFEYIFQKGDSIVFTYNEKIPFAKILNRDVSEVETNYDLKHREIICGNDYPALTKIIMPFMFVTYNSNYIGKEGERSGILGQIDKIKSDAQLRFTKEINTENNFLDSLLNESLLSNESFEWLKQKLEIKKYNEKAYNDNLNRSDISISVSKDSDSLLKYHSYRNLLATISSAYYDRKVKKIFSPNANLPDYKLVYDSIANSNLFSAKAKEILMFETSNRLMQNSGASAINLHLEKIEKDISDTSLISYLVDKYKLDNQISDDLYLVDFESNKITLMNFIKRNSDKVVYVDIWASWCAPCLEEFPKSKILTERVQSKNLVIIYLSIDSEINKWKSASKRNQLPNNSSFLIENEKTSKFLEKLNFNAIPRYLIFDKSGTLVDKDAPRPSDERTFQILDDLLKRNL